MLLSLGFVKYCLKWKLRKGQAVAAEQLAVVAALVLCLNWKELVMSVVCLLLAMYSNQSLVERLEVVVVLEELPEALCWQEWVAHLLLKMDPEVEVLEQRPIVLEFWNCVFFSSQEPVDIRSFESGPQLLLRRC
jgi:hypothetical protein